MPDSDEITAAGQTLFELFGACAGSPDDVAIGRAADDALWALEGLLIAAGHP
jgi:hypothetical protein